MIGYKQALLYCTSTNQKFSLTPTVGDFSFGTRASPSLGTIHIKIPTPLPKGIEPEIHVVAENVPLLLGLDIMEAEKLYVDTVRNKLVCVKDNWSVPLVRNQGHIFYRWICSEVFYTATELRKLHVQFFHPSSEKLYNLLNHSDAESVNTETRETLEHIVRTCDVCQSLAPRPVRFRVSLPDESLTFNKELALDLLWLDGQPVLHIVDIVVPRVLPGRAYVRLRSAHPGNTERAVVHV